MTHKLIHPESISKIHTIHILGILKNSKQPSWHYNNSSDWWLHDPKEHKEEHELRRNWPKLCYLLHIIHLQSIFQIFLITFLNSDIDLLDLTKLGTLFQIKDPRKWVSTINCRTCEWNEKYWTQSQVIYISEVWSHKLGVQGTITFVYFLQ